MRQATYEKVNDLAQRFRGYMKTPQLLKEGITNRQIGQLVDEGRIERVGVGTYWLGCGDAEHFISKPGDYKEIEASLVNPDVIICADSACFLQGLIDVEPEKLSIATKRSDRKKMEMNYPLSRHYCADVYFEQGAEQVQTDFGAYKVYEVDRSICDCIRFRETIETGIFAYIIDAYKENAKEQQYDRLLSYAKKMRISKQVRDTFE